MKRRERTYGTVIASLRSCVLVATRDCIASLIGCGRSDTRHCGRGLGAATTSGGDGGRTNAIVVTWYRWSVDASLADEGVTDQAKTLRSNLPRRKGSIGGIEYV